MSISTKTVGLVGVEQLSSTEVQEAAKQIFFGTTVAHLHEIQKAARSAARTLEADQDITPQGKVKRKAELAEAVLGNVIEFSKASVEGVAKRLESAAAGFDSTPVQFGDLLADHNARTTGLQATDRGRDVLSQLQLVRQELLNTSDPAELQSILRNAANAGSSLEMVALDSMATWLRDRVFKTAGMDESAQRSLRRSYREARNPEQALAVKQLGEIGAHLIANIGSTVNALRAAGLDSANVKHPRIQEHLAGLRSQLAAARS